MNAAKEKNPGYSMVGDTPGEQDEFREICLAASRRQNEQRKSAQAQSQKSETEKTEDEWEEEEVPELRPGQQTTEGGFYEPDREPPDYDEFVTNAMQGIGYEQYPEIGGATAWLRTDGAAVQAGVGERGEDHRGSLPTTEAMRRWGWPEEIVKEVEEGTRGSALMEMLRRSGLVRVQAWGNKNNGDAVFESRIPMTRRQQRAIYDHVAERHPKYLVIKIGNREEEFVNPDPEEIRDFFDRYSQ